MDFIWFISVVIGATLIVVDGSIFAPVREALEKKSFGPILDYVKNTVKDPLGFLKNMTDCYQCSGVWVGWLFGFLMKWDLTQIFCAGFAASFWALIGAYLLNYLESKIS
jgi:hypothetical protein